MNEYFIILIIGILFFICHEIGVTPEKATFTIMGIIILLIYIFCFLKK